jgi:hypothetical protein
MYRTKMLVLLGSLSIGAAAAFAQQGAEQSHPARYILVGKVLEITDDSLKIHDEHDNDDMFMLDPGVAMPEHLMAGETVQVFYHHADGHLMASEIHVRHE